MGRSFVWMATMMAVLSVGVASAEPTRVREGSFSSGVRYKVIETPSSRLITLIAKDGSRVKRVVTLRRGGKFRTTQSNYYPDGEWRDDVRWTHRNWDGNNPAGRRRAAAAAAAIWPK